MISADFVKTLIETFGGALATVIAGQLVAILGRVLQQQGLALSAEQQARLQVIARAAILRTEELFAAKLATGQEVTSADKLTHAINAVTAVQPSLSRDAAADLIHAVLPTVRAPNPLVLGAKVMASTFLPFVQTLPATALPQVTVSTT